MTDPLDNLKSYSIDSPEAKEYFEKRAKIVGQLEEYWKSKRQETLAWAASNGLSFKTMGGYSPVQIWGEFDGLSFYLRGRHNSIQFHVAASEEDIMSNDIWEVDLQIAPDGSENAGFIDYGTAVSMTVDLARAFRMLRK